MSRAVAAVHGQFGRAVIYGLNRPFNIHAHREGHLIFHLSGDNGGRARFRRSLPSDPRVRCRHQPMGTA